jgi:hypothetical protein
MRDVLAPLLAATLERIGPYDVRAMIAQGLQMGDECHNRNRASTSLFLREIVAGLIELEADPAQTADVCRFIDSNDHFVLNLVMPCAKAAADAARDVPGSSLIVAMARNGTDFGIQVSGTGDRWFIAPASTPEGLLFPGYVSEDVNPDIGDSTITETYGVGGCAMACAPAIVQFVGGSVETALATTHAAYEITMTENPELTIPALGFRGTPTGIDVARVVRTGRSPDPSSRLQRFSSAALLVSRPLAVVKASERTWCGRESTSANAEGPGDDDLGDGRIRTACRGTGVRIGVGAGVLARVLRAARSYCHENVPHPRRCGCRTRLPA